MVDKVEIIRSLLERVRLYGPVVTESVDSSHISSPGHKRVIWEDAGTNRGDVQSPNSPRVTQFPDLHHSFVDWVVVITHVFVIGGESFYWPNTQSAGVTVAVDRAGPLVQQLGRVYSDGLRSHAEHQSHLADQQHCSWPFRAVSVVFSQVFDEAVSGGHFRGVLLLRVPQQAILESDEDWLVHHLPYQQTDRHTHITEVHERQRQ